MRHFSDVRAEAKKIMTTPAIRARGEKWCLVWDLHGRLRVLCWPSVGTDSCAIATEMDTQMKNAMGGF